MTQEMIFMRPLVKPGCFGTTTSISAVVRKTLALQQPPLQVAPLYDL